MLITPSLPCLPCSPQLLTIPTIHHTPHTHHTHHRYTKHLDPDEQQLLLFPVQAAQHWSLLAYQPGIAQLHAADSGRTKLFAHTDEDYAPFITAIEKVLALEPESLAKSPLRLKVTIQPNSVDCGFHVALNARSLAQFVLEHDEAPPAANLKDDWVPPTSTAVEVRQYRKALCSTITALPFAMTGRS